MIIPDFDSTRQENEFGQPFWSARGLAPLLGYKKWQRFEDAIERAIESCKTNGNIVEQHFISYEKPTVGGHGAVQPVKDWALSKYGCWLIAMNGDVRKPEIAAAQAYFLVSTAENEMHKLRQQQEQRLVLREKVTEGNKSLFAAAALSGVQSPHFGIFEDSGILGQYTMTTAELEGKRGIGKGELYNTMPPHELAGNLLRITQTDYNLRTKGVPDEDAAIREHFAIGRQVRQAMVEMSGGEKPEDIPPAPSIRKEIQARRRKAQKSTENKPPDSQDTLF